MESLWVRALTVEGFHADGSERTILVEPLTLRAHLAALGETEEPRVRVTQISLMNRKSEPLELFLEPWGNHIFLDEGADYVVVSHNPTATASQPDLLIEWQERCVVLWANASGTMFEVFRNGVQVDW